MNTAARPTNECNAATSCGISVICTRMATIQPATAPIATITAMFVTVGGRSAWFVGVLLLMVYGVFAMTLYLMPPQAH